MSSPSNAVGGLNVVKGSGKTADRVFKTVAYAAGVLILVTLAAVTVFLLLRALPLITGDQNAARATIESFSGGRSHNFWQYVGPLVFGTVLVSALALLISFFVAVGIALFISHYAPTQVSTALSYVVDLLAAIPSVIYGLWGGLVLVPHIGGFWNWVATYLGWIPIFQGPAANPARTVGTVSVVLAVMILPIITSVSRDIFQQTPLLQQDAARGHEVGDDPHRRPALRPLRHHFRLNARPGPGPGRDDGRADDSLARVLLFLQAAAGFAEPDDRGEHRRPVPGGERVGRLHADSHGTGPVPDHLRGELLRPQDH